MSIAKFRKKPVIIEAMQWTGENYEEISKWLHSYGKPSFAINDGRLVVPTLEGDIYATIGDWIIKGVKGEFYPCKPDIFELTYEKIPNDNEIVLYNNVEPSASTIDDVAAKLRHHLYLLDESVPKDAQHRYTGDLHLTVAELRTLVRTYDNIPIYIYQSPIEKQLKLPELLEPLIIGPKASIELRWLRHG